MKTPTLERAHPAGMGGVQKIYRFTNNFGASVVRFPYSYGWSEGLWELAVLRWVNNSADILDFSLEYATYITDDVIGNLTEDEVDEILSRIEALPN